MSAPAAPEAIATAAGPAAPSRPRRVGLWVRVALAVMVLGASGGVRYWQGRRFDAAMIAGRTPPFPLKQIPMTLGPWQGTGENLDPEIARATGCTDYAFRTYTDDRTGTKLGVIVLYGPAAEVFIHAPDNCYPAQGYSVAEAPVLRQVTVADKAVPFHSAVYVKGEGGRAEYQEVYHSWHYGGLWTPSLPILKQAERIPGMLKVHVTRRVGPREYRAEANPCEEFLRRLVAEIQHRIDSAPASARVARR
jgi:hypothetical protein